MLLRRKSKERGPLDISQKLDIAHRVIVDRDNQAELAKEFRVSKGYISMISSKVREKPEVMREAFHRNNEKVSQFMKMTSEIYEYT